MPFEEQQPTVMAEDTNIENQCASKDFCLTQDYLS